MWYKFKIQKLCIDSALFKTINFLKSQLLPSKLWKNPHTKCRWRPFSWTGSWRCPWGPRFGSLLCHCHQSAKKHCRSRRRQTGQLTMPGTSPWRTPCRPQTSSVYTNGLQMSGLYNYMHEQHLLLNIHARFFVFKFLQAMVMFLIYKHNFHSQNLFYSVKYQTIRIIIKILLTINIDWTFDTCMYQL